MKILIYVLTYLVPKRKNTFITSTGRRDGMGAQVMAVYSAIAYCKAYQKAYVHTPMGHVDHNFYNDPYKDPTGYEYDPDLEERWVKEVNNFFSLGLNELQVKDINYKVLDLNNNILIGILKYCFFYHFNTVPILINNYQIFSCVDRVFEQYHILQDSFRKKFYSTPKTGYVVNKTKDCIDIALLVRRGDITSDYAQRYTTNEDIVERLTKMKAMFYDMKIPYNLHIYSEGSTEDFGDIPSFGTMHLNEHPFGYMINFVEADILICAVSAFSELAAILSKNIVIAEPKLRERIIMSNWFSYKDDLFTQADFKNAVKKAFEGKLAKA